MGRAVLIDLPDAQYVLFSPVVCEKLKYVAAAVELRALRNNITAWSENMTKPSGHS